MATRQKQRQTLGAINSEKDKDPFKTQIKERVSMGATANANSFRESLESDSQRNSMVKETNLYSRKPAGILSFKERM